MEIFLKQESTIAMARLLLPGDISLQVPPNLNSDNIKQLSQSGINDFGGISPVTKDYVNPEAPWHLEASPFPKDPVPPRIAIFIKCLLINI